MGEYFSSLRPRSFFSQRLLLQDLHDSHVCNSLLVAESEEDLWRSETPFHSRQRVPLPSDGESCPVMVGPTQEPPSPGDAAALAFIEDSVEKLRVESPLTGHQCQVIQGGQGGEDRKGSPGLAVVSSSVTLVKMLSMERRE